MTLNSAVIFYNTQLFKENGLEPPKTWDQLLQVSKEFQSKDIVPIAQSGKASYLLSLTHSVIGATTYDGNQFVEEFLTGEVNLHDPRFVESIKRMKELEPFSLKILSRLKIKMHRLCSIQGRLQCISMVTTG